MATQGYARDATKSGAGKAFTAGCRTDVEEIVGDYDRSPERPEG